MNEVVVGKGKNWVSVVGLGGSVLVPSVSKKIKAVSSLEDSKIVDIEIAQWGDNNKLPSELNADVKSVSVLGSGLRKKIKIHYGQGLTIVESDGEKIKEITEGEAIDFISKNKIQKRLTHILTDYEFFQLCFLEYILDNNGTSIADVRLLSAPYCRFSVSEADVDENGFAIYRSKYVVFSKAWADGSVSEENSVVLPVIDPDWSIEWVKEYCKSNGILKFVRPISLYMPETDYYPEPYWSSARNAGWVDIAKLIPLVKKAIIQNSMTLKYLVKIPHDYWMKKYPVGEYTDAERKTKSDEDLDLLDEFLSDYENTGSNITTYYDIDKSTGRTFGEWQIEVIDNKIKEGVLNLDSAAANSEILFAVGIDPTLVGSGMPGKELGAKSGSDKREAFNIAVADAFLDRCNTLEFMDFIRDFNGWNPKWKFKFKNTLLATTDKQPVGVEKKIQ